MEENESQVEQEQTNVEAPEVDGQQTESTEETQVEQEERQETEAEKRARKERNRAIREKYRAEAEAKVLKERLENLEREVSQRRTEQPARLDPEQFKTPEEYEQAILDAKVEAKVAETLKKEREAARLQAEQAQIKQARERFAQKAAEAQEIYTDFDEVVASASSVPISPAVERALMMSDNGPDLVYHFAKNPEVLERINRLHPVEAAFEVAKLSQKVQRPVTKASKAPEPVKPVTTAKSSLSGEPDVSDEKAWLAWRTKQVRNQR